MISMSSHPRCHGYLLGMESRALVRQFDGAGLTIQEVADRLGWCVSTVRKYQKMTKIDIPHGSLRMAPTEREEAMAAMYRDGKTLKEIGDLYGVSRERVRQVLSRWFNYGANDGGQSIQSRARKAARKQEREAKALAKYGCSYAEYRRLSKYGKKQVAAGERPCRNPVTAFNSQRTTARARGIEWNLKIWDWWQIWQSSGKWDDRGRDKGGYVMCRFKDVGAYEVGNVYIATNSSASRGARKRKYHHLPLGVTMSQGRFMAQISTGGKQKNLGCFDCADKASAAYQEALSAYLNHQSPHSRTEGFRA
jgi:DNA-binding CsgD family transcriptional regulator